MILNALAAIPAEWLILMGTLFGGGGLKLIEKYLNRDVDRMAWRKDYREEIRDLKERLDKVEAEVDEWRDSYYRNEEEISVLRSLMISKNIDPPPRRRPDSLLH